MSGSVARVLEGIRTSRCLHIFGLALALCVLVPECRTWAADAPSGKIEVDSVAKLWTLVAAKHSLSALGENERVKTLATLQSLVTPEQKWETSEEFLAALKRVQLVKKSDGGEVRRKKIIAVHLDLMNLMIWFNAAQKADAAQNPMERTNCDYLLKRAQETLKDVKWKEEDELKILADIDVYRRYLINGFEKLDAETVQEQLNVLGMPRIPYRFEVVKERPYLSVDVTFDLGFGKEVKYRQRIAHEVGLLLTPELTKVDLTAAFGQILAEKPVIRLGANCKARLERLQVVDGRVVADGSFGMGQGDDRLWIRGIIAKKPDAHAIVPITWEPLPSLSLPIDQTTVAALGWDAKLGFADGAFPSIEVRVESPRGEAEGKVANAKKEASLHFRRRLSAKERAAFARFIREKLGKDGQDLANFVLRRCDQNWPRFQLDELAGERKVTSLELQEWGKADDLEFLAVGFLRLGTEGEHPSVDTLSQISDKVRAALVTAADNPKISVERLGEALNAAGARPVVYGEVDVIAKRLSTNERIAIRRCKIDGEFAFVGPPDEIVIPKTNSDVLESLILSRLPRLAPDWMPADAVQCTGIDFDESRGVFVVDLEWNCGLFDAPLALTIDVPSTNPGAANFHKALRQSLAGKTARFSPVLQIQFPAELALHQSEWPIQVTVGKQQISGALVFDGANGSITKLAGVRADPDPIINVLQGHPVLRTLQSQSMDLACAEATLDLKKGKHAGLHVKVHSKSEPGAAITMALDSNGIHLDDWTPFAHYVIKKHVSAVGDKLPVQVSRMIALGEPVTELKFDAIIGDVKSPMISFHNWSLKLESEEFSINPGDTKFGDAFSKQVTDSSAYKQLATLLPFELRNFRATKPAAGKGLAFAADLVVFDSNRIEALVLLNVEVAANGLHDPGAVLRQLLKQVAGKADGMAFGPFRVTYKSDMGVGDRFYTVAISAFDGQLQGTAKLDTETFTVGPITLSGIDKASKWLEEQFVVHTAKMGRSAAGARVSINSLNLDNLAKPTVFFDVAVKIDGKEIVLPGNAFGPDGLQVGKIDNLVELAKAEIGNDVAKWAVGTEINLGAATLKVSSLVDGKASLACTILGRDAGPVEVDTKRMPMPVKIVEEKRFREAIGSAVGLDWIVGQAPDGLKVEQVRLNDNQMELTIAVSKLPGAIELNPALRLKIHIGGPGGVSIDGMRAEVVIERALWQQVAKSLEGKELGSGDLPIKLQLTELVGEESGVRIGKATGTIKDIGEISLANVRIGRKGIELDRTAFVAPIVGVLQRKLKEQFPTGVVVFDPVEVKDNVVEIKGRANIDALIIPFVLLFKPDGSIDGDLDFSAKTLVTAALNKLAAELKGKSIELPGEMKLTVDDVSVVDTAVVLGGTCLLYDPLSVKVSNVRFDGKKFDVSEMKVEADGKTAIKALAGSIGLPGAVEIEDAKPVKGDGGRFEGLEITATVNISGISGSFTALISRRGVKLRDDFTLTLGVVEIPLPPSPFVLTEPSARLNPEAITMSMKIVPAKKELGNIIFLKGTLRVPLRGAFVIVASGDLVLVGFLNVGHTEAVLDFPAAQFRTSVDIDLIKILTMTTRLKIDFAALDLDGSGDVRIFGKSMSEGHLKISKDIVHTDARMDLLGSSAHAAVDIPPPQPLHAKLAAGIAFGLDLGDLGKITVAGADIEAQLKAAKFAATILGLHITLLEYDLDGITKEKIIALLLRDRIIPSGLKLLKADGGSGHPIVTKGGDLIDINGKQIRHLRNDPTKGLMLTRGTLKDGGKIEWTEQLFAADIQQGVVNPNPDFKELPSVIPPLPMISDE